MRTLAVRLIWLPSTSREHLRRLHLEYMYCLQLMQQVTNLDDYDLIVVATNVEMDEAYAKFHMQYSKFDEKMINIGDLKFIIDDMSSQSYGISIDGLERYSCC